jgi:hypothetical protein
MIDTNKYKGRTLGQWSVESIRDGSIPWNTADEELCADAPLLLAEVKRLREIEQEWLTMWDTLEELNLVADVRKNMTEHGFTFETDEGMIE